MLHQFIADLGTSDVCHSWPGAWAYTWRQVAHLGIGAGLAFVPRPLALAVLAGWLAKEIALDPTGCTQPLAAALDSVADLALAIAAMMLTLHQRKVQTCHERK